MDGVDRRLHALGNLLHVDIGGCCRSGVPENTLHILYRALLLSQRCDRSANHLKRQLRQSQVLRQLVEHPLIANDQAADSSSLRPTNRAVSNNIRLSSAALTLMPLAGSRVATESIPPNALPKELMAISSVSLSPAKCLNRVSSCQTNLGPSLDASSERGSRPSFRAKENRNSVTADGDASASSLHHVGQAAFIAGSLSPIAFSCRLRTNVPFCDPLMLFISSQA